MCVYAPPMPENAANFSQSPSESVKRRLAFGVAALGVLTLLILWPYQHWDFTQRSSIVGGILRKAEQDA